jgi:biotin carboxyl carrier protein
MPGRITSILVKEGEQVREGAALIILEAMKMQNEITSPANGKVKTIFVREGETVKKESALVLIE